MSNLVARKRTDWRRQAMRQLRELATLAEHLGNRLDTDPELNLADLMHESSDLNSHVMSFITLVDRDSGLVEAGL